jgi:hypothetical protein
MHLPVAKIFVFLTWTTTFVFVVPARIIFPKGISLPGFLLVVYNFPSSREGNPWLYLITEYSYWFGLLLLTASSWLVIRVTKSQRISKIVMVVDFGIIVISLLSSFLGFAG